MKKCLLILVLFLSGCSTQPFFENSAEIMNETNKTYQYAAPWDEELYNSFYINKETVPDIGKIKGGVVPHHLLAGHIDAAFFDSLKKQDPSTIVLIGPNHFSRGRGKVISTLSDWKTIFGEIETNTKLVNKLSALDLVTIEEEVVKEEHAIYSLIPFIKKSLPNSQVLPLILRQNLSDAEMDNLASNLVKVLPKDAVIISSIDFSHYQTLPVANFHDELSRAVIKSFGYDRLEKLEIDSVPSLYVLLKLMEQYKTQKVAHEKFSNSALLANNLGIEETTSYYSPYFVSGKPLENTAASLLHFGDIILDRYVIDQIAANDEDYLLEDLAGEENRFFSGMDVAAANLEGPFANYRRKTAKEIAFQFDPALIPMLQKYNFSLFTLANNHSLDMGYQGFAESKENLTVAGIDFYGQQLKIDENSMIIKEIGGIKIAFIGLDDTIVPVDLVKIKELAEEAEEKADYTVVNAHWGWEYQVLNSNSHQQFLAHELIDMGADLIIGHHPHVIQEMEIYKNRPIFYSLGNFLFDQYFSVPTQQGLALGLIFDKQNNLSISVFPFEAEQSQVQLMDYKKASAVFNQFIDKSRLNKYNFNNFNLKVNFNN